MNAKRTKETATLGSGKVYFDEFEGELPPFEELKEKIVNKEHLLGWIKNGASLEYVPTFTTEKDDLGYVVIENLTEEEAKFKTGLFTWNGETFKQLTPTARVSTEGKYRIVKIGGVDNDDGKQYVILFVHEDKKNGNCYAVIVGRNTNGFTVTFQKDTATVIDAEFSCKPQDGEGTLIQFIEETGTSADDITQQTAQSENG